MFQNYIKIALRNLWKQKLFSIITIFGFASGLMVCFLAIAHIKAVFDYDNFHPKRDRIYRIITDVKSLTRGPTSYATSPLSLASSLKRDYDFIEETTRFIRLSSVITGNNKRLEVDVSAVDPGFFSLFHFPLEKGRPATDPSTVVITPKTAVRFFGASDPIGKVLHHDKLGLLTVTGVLAELPLNTHFKFEALISLTTFQQATQQEPYWGWQQYTNGYTYVLLKPTASVISLQRVLASLLKRTTSSHPSPDQFQYRLRPQTLSQISPALEMLNRRMLNEKYYGELVAELFIGLVTLLLASFNYINLTLARSISRAREVGVRKVMGAFRWQVMGQFMAESVVLALFALILASVLAALTRQLPAVQLWLLSGQGWDFRLWLLLTGFTLLTGILAGWIPARILSRFEPAQVFRSDSGLRVIRGLSFRKALIVAQFSISLIAMIVLMTMSRQFRFLSTADYGFRRERLLTVPTDNQPQQQRLINELRQVAGVERVSATSELLSDLTDFRYVRRDQNDQDSTLTALVAVDTNFVQTMGLSLVTGLNFPTHTGVASDQKLARIILINEEGVKAFGLGNTAEAIGRSVWLNDSIEVQVAGVLKNFRFSWLSQPIKPLVMVYQPNRFRMITIAVAEGSEQRVLTEIKQRWKRLLPYESFLGEWYDDYLYTKYDRSDFTDVFVLLIGLSLSIACLGLLGMVTYTIRVRVKEVGIRKVMGATVAQIVLVLSWDFVKLLVIALLIACPLGYMAGQAILANFAYRVSIGFETVGVCLGILLIIGGLTIGLQTYRAAQANPTDNLRTE